MKNFLKWLFGYEEPNSTTSDPERDYNCEPVDENNYQHYLPAHGGLFHEGKVDIVKSLSDEQVRSLLVDALCWNYFSIDIRDLRPAKAMRIALKEKLYKYTRENKEQKKFDDGVAAALAKRDADKPKTDGCATEPVVAPVARTFAPGALVEKPQMIMPLLSMSELANSLMRDFVGVKIPSDAPIEKVHSWAFDCFNTLRRINKEHPAVKRVQAEIDQHISDAADRKKMEGVVAEMVRPSSINKKPKTK